MNAKDTQEVDALIDRLAHKDGSLLDDPEFMKVPLDRAHEITERRMVLRPDARDVRLLRAKQAAGTLGIVEDRDGAPARPSRKWRER